MHGLHIRVRRHWFFGFSVSLILIFAGQTVQADTLNLFEAESLAIRHDPSVRAAQSRQTALSEREVAAGELPDPLLKLGAMSLPTDSFALGQEPMTQLQVGVVQKFPRGDTRSLQAGQYRERSKGMAAVAEDLKLRIQLAVREDYLEVLKQERLADINRAAEAAFSDLEQITQDYYATGRVQQQDVLRASVELAKVRERSARIAQQEDQARARLAAWIDTAAWQALNPDWPELATPLPLAAIKDALKQHPRVTALQQDILAADKGVELARQGYKPQFALDLTYGQRSGNNPDGSSRPDLLTFMVMMEMPLFSSKRQDRLTAASVAESSAAAFNRDDIFRRMSSEADLHYNTLMRQRERLELFERSLLPEVKFNADATFDAYQAALEDLTTLMRARITEFDLQLEYISLQAETYKSQARLLYLEGNRS